jgi:flagellar motor switch protein FliG
MVRQDFEKIYTDLKTPQKAALLLIALGQESATQIMRYMKPDELKAISYWITQMKHVPQELTEKVVKEFYERLMRKSSLSSMGGQDYLLGVLIGMMGETKAKEVLEDLNNREESEIFKVLKKVEPKKLAAYLKKESPQSIAVMLAHIEPDRSGDIITYLPEELQVNVVTALASLEEADPDIVFAMENALTQDIGSLASSEKGKKIGGKEGVASILNRMSDEASKIIMDKLSEDHFDLASDIKDLMFVFEDVVLLDDKSTQTLVKEIDQSDLIMALKGASDAVKEKFFTNISKRQAESINDELSFMGAVKGSVVKESQKRIVSTVRKLDEEGKVFIQSRGGGGDDVFE